MIDEKVELLANDEVSEGFHLARLRAPHIAAGAVPGQFVNIEVSASYAPFLRMPLSVCAVDDNAGTVDLLYESMGPKSAAFSRLRPGEQTRCLGPLGKGFSAPSPGARAILVGGGIGVPPMMFWGRTLLAQGIDVTLLVGARSASKHLPDELLKGGTTRLRRASDDGSLGHNGLVTDLLRDELTRGVCSVFTCGPHGMMSAVAALCFQADVPCQVSLEEYMACGIGICVGCVVRVENPQGGSAYADYSRICVDGPVFDARHIKWEH
ncbi:MAG: dihydroorotate dehydrogenase electron transfer subunit [Candidatus Latescibacterota bacterium]|jgi:dihydroorotate dehydrogenase electron transfer subunit